MPGRPGALDTLNGVGPVKVPDDPRVPSDGESESLHHPGIIPPTEGNPTKMP
jgi:hypothetical protein